MITYPVPSAHVGRGVQTIVGARGGGGVADGRRSEQDRKNDMPLL